MPVSDVDRFVLRRARFELSDEQEALQDSTRRLLRRSVPSGRVRNAEPVGFDEALWRELTTGRLVMMSVPAEVGGDGAGLIELAVVAEELGRVMAPAPIVEGAIAFRWLSQIDDALAASELADEALTVALRSASPRQLVPAGAVATRLLWHDGNRTELAPLSAPHEANLGSLPVAWFDPSAARPSGQLVDEGPGCRDRYRQMVDEWRLVAAAFLIGMGQTSLDLGVSYARDRRAFGAPIGSFQGISHPLASCEIHLAAARRLVRKAAWFGDHDATAQPWLPTMAFVAAAEAAEGAAQTAMHVQGGVGFTLESDLQLLLRRIKATAVITGDSSRLLIDVADRRYPTIERGA